ncbi:hypothetical protein FRB97_008979 [Tulasnella sp. 331]|nr:hypothetical protein FRB97_008979 [Tulasnella sp. 331]
MDMNPFLHNADAFLFSGTQSGTPSASPATLMPYKPAYASSKLSSESFGTTELAHRPRTFREFEFDKITPSVIDLIRAALLESPDHKATLEQICYLITKCYKDVRRFKRLRGNVRQRLSLKPWFRLAERPEWQRGKGQYWLYVEALDTSLVSIPRRGRNLRSPHQAHRQPPHSSIQTQHIALNDNPIELTQPHGIGVHSPVSSLPPSNHIESSIITTAPTSNQYNIFPFADIGLRPTSSSITPTMTSATSYASQNGFDGGLDSIQRQLGDPCVSSLSPMWVIPIPVEMPPLEAAAAWMKHFTNAEFVL